MIKRKLTVGELKKYLERVDIPDDYEIRLGGFIDKHEIENNGDGNVYWDNASSIGSDTHYKALEIHY